MTSLLPRRVVVPALVALAATATTVPAAHAAFSDTHRNTLLSINPANPTDLGDGDSRAVGLSSNGRYALVAGRAQNLSSPPPAGQFVPDQLLRKDRATGALEPVVDTLRYRKSDNQVTLCGASTQASGISGDGRFVAFSTSQRLTATDTNDDPDVYLRDMTKGAGAADAYRLVSARDGSNAAASYDPPTDSGQCDPGAGSGFVSGAGASVSDDGNRVLFVTRVNSDLPASGAPDTPAYNLFVRDVAARKTILVTKSTDPDFPFAGTSEQSLAVLSGDGSTVAWSGRNAEAQLAANEYSPDVEQNGLARSELLWRNLAQGVTRRVAPLVDYQDPGCTDQAKAAVAQTDFATNPNVPESACLTPFLQASYTAHTAISLSTDGRTVAFTRTGGRRGTQKFPESADVWVSDMRPGVTRKQGSREITRAPYNNGSGGLVNSSIAGVALAGNASRLIFFTGRPDFSNLTSPAATGTFFSLAQAGAGSLYSVDLSANTLELATRAFDGGPFSPAPGGGGLVPALSADGSVAAWTTGSPNVLAGDSNDATDAFALEPVPATPPQDNGSGQQPPPSSPGPLPPPRAPGVPSRPVTPARATLGSASAKVGKGGVVTLSVKVSGRGKVSARGTAKSGRKKIVFGTGSASSKRAGTVKVKVKPTRSGRKLVGKRVKVSFVVTFTQTGVKKAASRTVTVTLPRGRR